MVRSAAPGNRCVAAVVAVCALLLSVSAPAGAASHLHVNARRVVVLRVHALPTTYGISGNHARYPLRIRVEVPANYARLVAAYGVGGYLLVAPKGWTGHGLMGADGSSGATIHATAAALVPGTLTVQQSSACWGCGWYDAAPYFGWVRDHWPSGLGGGAPSGRSGLTEYFERPNLVFYAAPYTNDGLQVNGIAYAAMVGRAGWDGSPSPGFVQAEVHLPTADHNLATVVLNYFLSRFVPGE